MNLITVIEEGIYEVYDLNESQIESVMQHFESLGISVEHDSTWGEVSFYQERTGTMSDVLSETNSVMQKLLEDDPEDCIKVSNVSLGYQQRIIDGESQRVVVLSSEGSFEPPAQALLQQEESIKSREELVDYLQSLLDEMNERLDEILAEQENEELVEEPTQEDFDSYFLGLMDEQEDDAHILLDEVKAIDVWDALKYAKDILDAGASARVAISITPRDKSKDEPLADDVLELLSGLGFSFD